MNYGFVLITFVFFNNAFICEHFPVLHDVKCVLFLCSLRLFECLLCPSGPRICLV